MEFRYGKNFVCLRIRTCRFCTGLALFLPIKVLGLCVKNICKNRKKKTKTSILELGVWSLLENKENPAPQLNMLIVNRELIRAFSNYWMRLNMT